MKLGAKPGVSKEVRNLLIVLGLSSLVSLVLMGSRIVRSDSLRYSFLVWNLLLAWVPLGLAWWLVRFLRTHSWLSWQAIGLTALWFIFLPNSFYLVSDFVHLRATYEVNILYDVVLLTSFAFNGLVLGFMGLYAVHRELLKRFVPYAAHTIVGFILLICSFAIYLGRYLRWNTWDILASPAGILFDISDRVINPSTHLRTFTTTATFFILLSSMYMVMWSFVAVLKRLK